MKKPWPVTMWILTVLLLAVVSEGQYVWRDIDIQQPGENHVIGPVFSGNTPFLGFRIYDDQTATTTYTNWTWRFYYSMRREATNGWVITGTTSTNTVMFNGGTNVFFRPYDRYYFSVMATSTSGQVRTFARGRMEQEYDPNAGDMVAGAWVSRSSIASLKSGTGISITSSNGPVPIIGIDNATYLQITNSVQTEADPIWGAVSNAIHSSTSSWWAAHSWGDHALAGYLTTEPDWAAVSNAILSGTSSWWLAHSWGDHDLVGYLTAETDPIWGAVSNAMLSGTSSWWLAYTWGDHATNGYVTQTVTNGLATVDYVDTATNAAVNDATGRVYAALATWESDPIWGAVSNAMLVGTSSWWTAFGWGDHSVAGYATTIALTAATNAIWVATTNLCTTATNTLWASVTDLVTATTNTLWGLTTDLVTATTNTLWGSVTDLVTASSNTSWIATTNLFTGGTQELWVSTGDLVDAATNAAVNDATGRVYAALATWESDPIWSAVSNAFQSATSSWWLAHSWGDHSAAGYLTAETDPSFPASPAAGDLLRYDGTNWTRLTNSYVLTAGTLSGTNGWFIDDSDGTNYWLLKP